MNALTPRRPSRPLIWPDVMHSLRRALLDNPDPIYVVGGAVRDALLHRPLVDIDLTVRHSAIPLARRIANHFRGDFFVLDAERDVGRALIATSEGRLVLDVARFRGESLLADLTDRDFTVNALAMDLRGDLELLIDPLGGEADLLARQLRRCNPDSLGQDALRALRAVRLAAQLDLRIETDTLRDVRRWAPHITATSPERARDEFFKLLALPNPASALRIAAVTGVLRVIVPEIEELYGLEQGGRHAYDAWGHTLAVVNHLANVLAVLNHNRSDNLVASFALGMLAIQLDRYRGQIQNHLAKGWPNERSHRALLALAALLHDIGKPATRQIDEQGDVHFPQHQSVGAELAARRAAALRLSNAELQRLIAIIRHHSRVRDLLRRRQGQLDARAIHRYWRQLGADAGVDVCLLSLADYLGGVGAEIRQDKWLNHIDCVRELLQAEFELHDRLVAPPPLVDGNRLLQTFDLKPGPIIGELLDLLREAQVADEIRTEAEALQLARDYLLRSS